MSDNLSDGMDKEEMLLEIVDEWLYMVSREDLALYAGHKFTQDLRKLSKKKVAEKYDAMVNDKGRMERKQWMARKPQRRF